MTVNHGDHVILDAVAVAFPLAADQHFQAFIRAVPGGESVVTMHLLKGAPHSVNGHFPELRGNGLFNLGILNTFDAGFQIGTHLESTFHGPIILLPDATSLVATKPGIPGVTVFIGSTKGVAAVAAGGHGWKAGDGHGKTRKLPRPYRACT